MNQYATELLVKQRIADFRREADQDRLAGITRQSRAADTFTQRAVLRLIAASGTLLAVIGLLTGAVAA